MSNTILGTIGHRNLMLVRNTPSHNVLSFSEVSLNSLLLFLSYCRDTSLTSDLTATLTLGVGTLILCITHLLIILYLSVKFHQICLSSL